MSEKLANAQEILANVTSKLKRIEDIFGEDYGEEIWFDETDLKLLLDYDEDDGFMIAAYIHGTDDCNIEVRKTLHSLLDREMVYLMDDNPKVSPIHKKFRKDDTNKFLDDLDEIVAKLRANVSEVGFRED